MTKHLNIPDQEHRCQASTVHGKQCIRAARAGYNMCGTHGWGLKYYIAFSWQVQPGDRWFERKKACWPILFATRAEAETHLYGVQVFKNLDTKNMRKLAVYVTHTKRTFPAEGLVKY